MDWIKKILPTIGSVAPTLATALGGPLAGMAVGALASALGITADPSTSAGQDAITRAVLGMTPEIAAQVRKADQDFALKMRSLDIDLEKLAQADRDSARNMQVQTKDWTPRFLAGGIVLGLFTLLALMTFQDLPAANHDALMMLLGSLSAAFTAVVGFYYGSSAGSQAKDATIHGLTEGK